MKAELHILGLAMLLPAACAHAQGAAQTPPADGRKSGSEMSISLPGGAEMEMIWCAPGSFAMGSPDTELGRLDDETRHMVSIKRGFWLGKYEVTQRQWESVMRSNPSRFKDPNRPVETVSWHDCEMFLRRVNAALPGMSVRLPTEAEWEYACRAGSDNPVSGSGSIGDMAWYDMNSDSQTHEVGRNKSNAWGFYDMHGNVLEWCSDWFFVPPAEDVVDPKGPPIGSFKVLRGGCWFFYDKDCRSAYRLKRDPRLRNCIFGFRLACADGGRRTPAAGTRK
ncbi:MAG: formylglycine-generating enzyme family protein [Kiritimatiellae bacterium]|nr:formylglycine-generating enzyme family protein [Kiritimatiellia bacterium]